MLGAHPTVGSFSPLGDATKYGLPKYGLPKYGLPKAPKPVVLAAVDGVPPKPLVDAEATVAAREPNPPNPPVLATALAPKPPKPPVDAGLDEGPKAPPADAAAPNAPPVEAAPLGGGVSFVRNTTGT